MPKFTLYTDKNNDYRWKFTASNDRVVARSSEGHRTREACLESLALLQKDVVGAGVDPMVTTADGPKPVAGGAVAPAGGGGPSRTLSN